MTSLTARGGSVYSPSAVYSVVMICVGLFAILMTASFAPAQEALPTLRGIVVLPNGDGRAYFEDPHTGRLAGYAPNEAVGDSRIEEIREDRVVLRRGSELVQVLLSAQAPDGDTPRDAAASAEGTAAAPDPTTAAPATPRPATADATFRSRAIIGNGQPWLERLGIPPQALSQAIEQALPAQESNNLEE